LPEEGAYGLAESDRSDWDTERVAEFRDFPGIISYCYIGDYGDGKAARSFFFWIQTRKKGRIEVLGPLRQVSGFKLKVYDG
jgi:hypothetical protein